MARIRTIKPEFWTDDLLGSISREARLLFIATWNMADDEGLLRWSPPFLKGAVFPFDDDLSVKDVQKLMAELEAAGIIFAYTGGRSQQALAYIPNFHKHQKINRPSPSRLPPPPLQDHRVKDMYAARDGNVCHLCLLGLDEKWSEKFEGDFLGSPDHVKPQAQGGTDYPSNIRIAHLTCNKGRRDRTIEQYRDLLRHGKGTAQHRFPERFANLSLNDSLSRSVPEGEGEQDHGNGTGNKELDLGPEKDGAVAPSPTAEAVEMFNAHAAEHDWPKVQVLNATRKRALDGCLKAIGGLDGWQTLLAKVTASDFLMGRTKRSEDHESWRFDFDFLLKPKRYIKLMEGGYDNAKHQPNGNPSSVLAGFTRAADSLRNKQYRGL